MGLLKGGSRAYDVARRFGCNERTIYRLQQRVLLTASVNDPPRSGRPRITTPREDKYMVTSSRRHRFIPATTFLQRLRQATRTKISVYTDRNRLSAARLRAQRPYIPLRNVTESHAWIGCVNTTVGLVTMKHDVIILFSVTFWRPTSLTRSNGLPDHQICHQ